MKGLFFNLLKLLLSFICIRGQCDCRIDFSKKEPMLTDGIAIGNSMYVNIFAIPSEIKGVPTAEIVVEGLLQITKFRRQ